MSLIYLRITKLLLRSYIKKSYNNIFTPKFSKTLFRPLYKMSGDQTVLNTEAEGLKLKDIVIKLEQFADPRLAEKWDNVGLLIEPATRKLIHNIMLTNDLTEKVMEEAIDKKIDLIISYHPPIFKPLKRITNESWKERIVASCLENRIAVYSPHTAWDSVPGGVTDWLADTFNDHLEDPIEYGTHALIPQLDEELDPNSGMGRLVYVKDITVKDCVQLIKARTELNHLRVALGSNKTIDSEVKVIVVVCGSGNTILKDTVASLFVTGEMSHHELLEANHNGITVILTNHSDSERGFLVKMCQNLDIMLDGKANIFLSEYDQDPLITV